LFATYASPALVVVVVQIYGKATFPQQQFIFVYVRFCANTENQTPFHDAA
jgi:hypothetical protein